MGFLQQLADFILDNGQAGKSYINNIPIDVISDKSRSLATAVTSKRVESGFNITDTTRREQQIINITVVDNSFNYMSNREALEKLQASGELCTFVFSGRDNYENMVIENIEEIESKDQKNGFTFHITLRQIQIAEISENDVEIDYKGAGCTGGDKVRRTAKINTPSNAEIQKVNKVKGVNGIIPTPKKERKKTALKNTIGGFF